MGYIYLAHPFSSKNKSIQFYRYQIASAACAHFKNLGQVVYAPIVMWYDVGRNHDLPTDYRTWEHDNETMLRNASLLRILDLPGLDQSKGTAFEIMVANKYGVPIEVYHPGEIETYQRLSGFL